MKTKLSVITATLLLSHTSYAELGEPGFSGSVGLGTGIFSESNNLSTDGNEIVPSTVSASSESEISIEPIVKLEYVFGQDSHQKAYAGTHNEELINSDLAMELGYAYELRGGTVVDVSYILGLMNEEVWSNPYAWNTKREVTDSSESAFRLQAEDILGSNFAFDGLYFTKDIDQELSDKALERSGSGFSGTLFYTHFLNETSALTPSVTYSSFSADGDAMSYSSYCLGLEYMKQMGQHAISLGGEYSNTAYDGRNTEFGKTQDDTGYGVTAMYQYEEFMDWEDVTFLGLVSYESISSNIDFYDNSEYQVMVGLTYDF